MPSLAHVNHPPQLQLRFSACICPQIQMLQRRLIAMTEAGVKKGMQLEERDAQIADLQHQLAARPGPEVLAQLCREQGASAAKSKKIKALAAELNLLTKPTGPWGHAAAVADVLDAAPEQLQAAAIMPQGQLADEENAAEQQRQDDDEGAHDKGAGRNADEREILEL